jgi:hypothetical protein
VPQESRGPEKKTGRKGKHHGGRIGGKRMSTAQGRHELNYFTIGSSIGGNQEWFCDPMMRLGGCAAETACDSSIWFSLHFGRQLYPFDVHNLRKKDYKAFGAQMKPYLRPRFRGIDRLSIYTDGFGAYLRQHGETGIQMEEFSGDMPQEIAFQRIAEQIDAEIPVPMLMLKHQDRRFEDYVWHWFILAGYDADTRQVKTVTYSEAEWVDFPALWNTGYAEKGGLILFHLSDEEVSQAV